MTSQRPIVTVVRDGIIERIDPALWRDQLGEVEPGVSFPGRRMASLVSQVVSQAPIESLRVTIGGYAVGSWRPWTHEGVLSQPQRPLLVEAHEGGRIVDSRLDLTEHDDLGERARGIEVAETAIDVRGRELWRAVIDRLGGGSVRRVHEALDRARLGLWPARPERLMMIGDMEIQVIVSGAPGKYRIARFSRGVWGDYELLSSATETAHALAVRLSLHRIRRSS